MTLIIPKSIPGVTPNPGHFTAVLKKFPEIQNWWSLAQSRYTAASDGTGNIILPRIGNANLFESDHSGVGVTRWGDVNGYDVARFNDANFGDAIRSNGYAVDLPTVSNGVKSFVWVARRSNANDEMWCISLAPDAETTTNMRYSSRTSGLGDLTFQRGGFPNDSVSFNTSPTDGTLNLSVLVVDFANSEASLSVNDSAFETVAGTDFASFPAEPVQQLHLGYWRDGNSNNNQGYNGVIPEFGIVDGDVRSITGFMDAIKAQATRVYGASYA